jgi:hypothetical protein
MRLERWLECELSILLSSLSPRNHCAYQIFTMRDICERNTEDVEHHGAEIEKWWPIIKGANIKGE